MTPLIQRILSQVRQDARQINWWLMLIPVAGWALSVGLFWAEVAIRPPKPAAAAQATAPAPAAAPGVAGKKTKMHTADENFNDPFYQSLQNYLDRDCVAANIVGLAAVIYLLCAFRQRSILCLLLGLLALTFTFRELRDVPGLGFMSTAVYIIAGALAVLGAVFFQKVTQAMRADWRHTSWFLAVFAAYAVALLVQRRAFKWGPSERHIHRPLEECTETLAHAMFVVAALMALCRRKPAQAPAA
jgi:hypothetical protein